MLHPSPWPAALLVSLMGCPPPATPPQALAEPPPVESLAAPSPPPVVPDPPVLASPMVFAPLPGCTVPPGAVLEEPSIVGSLDDQAVREAVYQQLDRIGKCVDWAVGYDLFERGQLVIRMAVAPAGRVTSVEMVADATGGDPDVQACLEAAFGDLVFPRTSTVTWVCYPINVAY